MLLTILSVGQVLDLYDAEHPTLGPTQVAELLGTSRSKAHLLLSSMAEIGLLRRHDGGRYSMGWRALSMERLITGSTPFRPLARHMAQRLARHTGELIHVGALDTGRVVYVDRVTGARAIEVSVSEIGSTLPAHCSGIGKTLLAHLDAADIEATLDRYGMPRLTPATICDRDELYAELHRIRRDGVAFDREEVQVGLSCAAAPIIAADGTVAAALSISAPTERFRANGNAYPTLITKAAAQVSRQLHASELEDIPALS